jgi:heme exporter protein D
MVPSVPVAHAGHFVWLLFVLPIAIVVGMAVRSLILQRRETRDRRQRD